MGYNSVENQIQQFHQNNETIQDFQDFFTQKRHSHLTKYIYFGIANDWYQKLQDYKPYYLIEKEKHLIRAIMHEGAFLDKLKSYNINQLFEIGPGTITSLKHKTIPLLKAIRPTHYYAIDICPPYALSAARYIYKVLKINPNVLCHDAFANLNLPINHTSSCLMILGSTFGNLTSDAAHAFLMQISNTLKRDDYLIISFDSNKNGVSLRKAYDNKFTKQLALTPMRFFKQHCDLVNFDSEAFKFCYRWNKELSAAQLVITPTIKQKITLNSLQIILETHLKLAVTFSRKYLLSELNYLVEKYYFTPIDIFKLEDNPIILVVFKKQ